MIGRFAILALAAAFLVTMDSGCRRIRPPVTMKQPKSQPATQVASQPASQPRYAIYTVRSGDTLRTIAQREMNNPANHVLILKANPGLDPRKLTVGQQIKIPILKKKAPPAKP